MNHVVRETDINIQEKRREEERQRGGEGRGGEEEKNTRSLDDIIGLWTGCCGSRGVENRVHLHHKWIDEEDFFR